MSGICQASSGPTRGTSKEAAGNRAAMSMGKSKGEWGSGKLTQRAKGSSRCSSIQRVAWRAVKVPRISS